MLKVLSSKTFFASCFLLLIFQGKTPPFVFIFNPKISVCSVPVSFLLSRPTHLVPCVVATFFMLIGFAITFSPSVNITVLSFLHWKYDININLYYLGDGAWVMNCLLLYHLFISFWLCPSVDNTCAIVRVIISECWNMCLHIESYFICLNSFKYKVIKTCNQQGLLILLCHKMYWKYSIHTHIHKYTYVYSNFCM